MDDHAPDQAGGRASQLAHGGDDLGGTRSRRELETALEHDELIIAVAAHELHGPLAALSALAHVLRDGQANMPPDVRSELIDRILGLTGQLQLLVRKLLTTADMDAAGFPATAEDISVLAVINSRLAAMNTDTPVRVDCDPDVRAVADPAELSMMIGNCLVNALVYAKPPFQIRAAERDGWAVIRVTDSGPGVPRSFVPRLFERFTRAPGSEAKSDGSGLGLWITRTFARENGGDAWYEPTPDGGSCFCIRLPLPNGRPDR